MGFHQPFQEVKWVFFFNLMGQGQVCVSQTPRGPKSTLPQLNVLWQNLQPVHKPKTTGEARSSALPMSGKYLSHVVYLHYLFSQHVAETEPPAPPVSPTLGSK